jgi:hypothetical protein
MLRKSTLLIVALTSIVTALAVTGGALAARGGNSANAHACQKGGWQLAQTGAGALLNFANQDECVSFGAGGGVLFAPRLTPNPTHVPEGTDSFVVASGFHPNSTGDMTVQVQTLSGPGSAVTFLGLPTSSTGGLLAPFQTGFTAGACANGTTGTQLTFTDAFGVHATTTVTLDCP